MMISDVIAMLKRAKTAFGDVPVELLDSETGNLVPIGQIIKYHPYTQGLLDRSKPVNRIVITKSSGNAKDLVLT